jgi:hypothetical protein
MTSYYSVTYGKNLLRKIGAPYNVETDKFLTAWAMYENTPAKWNPFGSTQGGQFPVTHNPDGSLNSAKVRDYPDWQTGVQYTALCLLNGNYPTLVATIRAGKSAQAMALALSNTQWGSGKGPLLILSSGQKLTNDPIGSCYPVPPAAYTARPVPRYVNGVRITTSKMVPGDTGADVDELLRRLGSFKFYDGSKFNPLSPVGKVYAYQLAHKSLWPADGIVGPLTYKAMTGHA